MPAPAAGNARLGLQTLSALALRGFQLGAVLATTLLLARVLGPSEFGRYSYASGWLALLANFATAGFTFASVRDVAQGLALGRHAEVRSHIKTAYALAFGLSLPLAALGLAVPHGLFAEASGMGRGATLAVAFTPLLTVVLVAQAVLRGQGHNVRALAGEQLVLPALMLLAIAGLALAGPSFRHAQAALWLYGGCLLVAAIFSLVVQWRALPPELRHGEGGLDRRWLSAALPFVVVLVSVTLTSQFDVLVVGQKLGPEQTGVYAFASRLATLPAIVAAVVATPLSPAVAALFAKGEKRELQRLVSKAALASALGGSLVAAGVVAGAPWLMRAIEPSFVAGASALLVLCLGRVIEAWFGPAGTVLAMTRHAWPAALGVSLGAAASVGLNLLLVGPFGIEGAAVGTATSCVVRAGAMWFWTRRHEGVKSSAVEALVGRS